jgi:hypothetical protein
MSEQRDQNLNVLQSSSSLESTAEGIGKSQAIEDIEALDAGDP